MESRTKTHRRSERIAALTLLLSLLGTGCGGLLDDNASRDSEDIELSPGNLPFSDAAPISAGADENRLCSLGVEQSGVAFTAHTNGPLELLIERVEDGESTTDRATVTVLEVTDAGVLYEWRSPENLASSVPADVVRQAGMTDVVEQLEDRRLVYRLTNTGVQFENIEEIRQHGIRSSEVLLQMLSEIGATEELARVSGTIELQQNMPEAGVINEFAPEPYVWHRFDGVALDEGQVLTSATEIPNAFGGRPFPASTTLAQQSEVDEDLCEVVTESIIADSEQISEIFVESFGETFAEADSDLSSLAEMAAGFKVETIIEARFDAGARAMREVTSRETATMSGQSSTQSLTITNITGS